MSDAKEQTAKPKKTAEREPLPSWNRIRLAAQNLPGFAEYEDGAELLPEHAALYQLADFDFGSGRGIVGPCMIQNWRRQFRELGYRSWEEDTRDAGPEIMAWIPRSFSNPDHIPAPKGRRVYCLCCGGFQSEESGRKHVENLLQIGGGRNRNPQRRCATCGIVRSRYAEDEDCDACRVCPPAASFKLGLTARERMERCEITMPSGDTFGSVWWTRCNRPAACTRLVYRSDRFGREYADETFVCRDCASEIDRDEDLEQRAFEAAHEESAWFSKPKPKVNRPSRADPSKTHRWQGPGPRLVRCGKLAPLGQMLRCVSFADVSVTCEDCKDALQRSDNPGAQTHAWDHGAYNGDHSSTRTLCGLGEPGQLIRIAEEEWPREKPTCPGCRDVLRSREREQQRALAEAL